VLSAMSSQLGRLIPQLRVPVKPKYKKLSNIQGSYGRLKNLRRVVTALVRDERIEMPHMVLDEARGYAERLIQDAIKHGDRNTHVMDMANFWLEEKQLVHKLFKVLAPRYADYRSSYTSLYKLPPIYQEPGQGRFYNKNHDKGVLELKENPFPSLQSDTHFNKNLLHNVLLDEARKQYRHRKYQQMAAALQSAEPSPGQAQQPEPASPASDDASVSDGAASQPR